MTKQPKENLNPIEKMALMHSPEKDCIKAKIDKKQIKQFARRLYEDMKKYLTAEHEECEKLLDIIFENA
ncbi:MAG: hypothetical protein FWE22_04960 [Firmicutes bacterium]|nr:hypothetical protein [Bacillota bacterium]